MNLRVERHKKIKAIDAALGVTRSYEESSSKVATRAGTLFISKEVTSSGQFTSLHYTVDLQEPGTKTRNTGLAMVTLTKSLETPAPLPFGELRKYGVRDDQMVAKIFTFSPLTNLPLEEQERLKRNGIGSALYGAVVADVWQRGAVAIVLETTKDEGTAFFESKEFKLLLKMRGKSEYVKVYFKKLDQSAPAKQPSKAMSEAVRPTHLSPSGPPTT